MAENKIELKSIRELLGMRFFIPSYQRGYRWTEQQVEDLLNDVNDYKATEGSFYCLQPLVVKRREEDIFDKIKNEAKDLPEVERLLKGAWEVIDGQQRLTTIFIILSCINQNELELFSLEYATRKDSQEFLSKIEDDKKEKNIDYYNIVKAKQTTEKWLKEHDINYDNYTEKLLNNVKFIWYQSIEKDPIEIFTRLNIGKISLTNSELIKALILNQSNFPDNDKSSIRLKQQEIASEWDNIEYTLQNDEFWLFLHRKGYDKPTRIDFIFNLICEQNKLKLNGDINNLIGSDEYRTFRYFYEYFKSPNTEQIRKIKDCWSKVKEYYQTFLEWFNDLELYHYVGVLLSDDFRKEKRKLTTLVNKWGGTKKDFLQYLKEQICVEIKIPNDKCFCDENNIEKSLHFDSDKTLIRKILLMHNIQSIVIKNRQIVKNEKFKLPTFYKFPFHHFKSENWNVEHIDSNTTNELTDPKQQQEWLLAAWIIVPDNLKIEIQDLIAKNIFGEADALQCESFKKLYEKINKHISNESNRLDENQRMRIWNLALLDETTNKGYHNDIFPLKRRCLIGKDQGEIINSCIQYNNDKVIIELSRLPAAISFIPPCTMNAFLKYYTPATSNLMDWDKTDARNYKCNILKTLKEFGLTELSTNNKVNNEQ